MGEAGVDFSREGATVREEIFSCGEGGAPGGGGREVLLGRSRCWGEVLLGPVEGKAGHAESQADH